MTTFVAMTQVGGISVSVTPGAVSYVRQHPTNPGRCFVGNYAQRGEPIEVLDSASNVAAALAAATGLVVSGYPFAPFVPFPLVGQPASASLFLQGEAVAFLRADARAPAQASYVQTHSQGYAEGPWHVGRSVSAIVNALEAASGSGGAGTGVGPIWQWAAGSGLFNSGEAAYGWDIAPPSWGTVVDASLFGGEAIEATAGESSGPAIAVRWMPPSVPIDPAALLAQSHASCNASITEGGAGGICVGLVLGDSASEVGVLFGVRMLGAAGGVSSVCAQWNGGASITNQFERPITPAPTPPSVGLYLGVDGGAQLDPGTFPRACGGTGMTWLWTPDSREGGFAGGLFGALPPTWSGAEPTRWGLALWSLAPVVAGNSARVWDLGVWSRVEGGTAAPVPS